MGQNLIEKIAQRYAVGLQPDQIVRSGDYLSIQPAHVMTHDNTGAVLKKFVELGASKVANPRQPVFALDHNIQDTSPDNLKKYAKIAAFAELHGIDFYPAGRGIGHQIMCEEGYAFPGSMMVASDSHSNMYGGLGALGTPVVRTDAAAIWATGKTWWQVPPVAKVELSGKLLPGVTGKDVIITLCGVFNRDEVLNHAIEFTGSGIASLSIEQRLAIANMTTEWGALAGVFPIDDVLFNWLDSRIAHVSSRGVEKKPSDVDGAGKHPRLNSTTLANLRQSAPRAEFDASYALTITLDLSTVRPHISGPNHVKVMKPVQKAISESIKIHKAYLVSCVNSRLEDIAEAASVVDGKHVAEGVQFYIAAASSEVQSEAMKRGDWQKLLAAGAMELPPGCGPCIGLGVGLLEDGEVGISATNRNFKGRMGSPKAQAYLASPAVVAASALTGFITAPFELDDCTPFASITHTSSSAPTTEAVQIVSGFAETWSGELLFCHIDNMNTDGIYPGKYTYVDDMTPAQQAVVAMENYDPLFQQNAREGDILVGGFNFGTGSSREQAATALKHRGIFFVIAGSFNETYKRNAINNGFLAIEAPELVQDLKATFGADALTVRTKWYSTIDFRTSTLSANGKVYHFAPVGPAAQELIVVGGLEAWVKSRL